MIKVSQSVKRLSKCNSNYKTDLKPGQEDNDKNIIYKKTIVK